MTAPSAASRKAIRMALSIFRRGFNSSKCKSMAKMAVARIKLLRNKREAVVRQMRRDIAMLLESGQDATARVRVEHVIREQNILAANEFIELFCELVVARLSVIAKQRECPPDLKEGISSIIFAAPRCSDIPELLAIRDIFEKKYGKDFVSAATDLRPNAGVNRTLIEKLSIKSPTGETKLKLLKEIAKEYQANWDTTETEVELLKPPEKPIEGPNQFLSASSLPLKPSQEKSSEPRNWKSEQSNVMYQYREDVAPLRHIPDKSSEPRCLNDNVGYYEDSASAAEAAAKFAKKAASAAETAAVLANRDSQDMNSRYDSKKSTNASSFRNSYSPGDTEIRCYVDDQYIHRRHNYNVPPAHSNIKLDESDYDEEIEMKERTNGVSKLGKQTGNADARKVHRRHSTNSNAPTEHSDIKFDESDCDDDPVQDADEFTRGTNRPPVVRVHPKLPDYDTLAARFEAQKHQKPPT